MCPREIAAFFLFATFTTFGCSSGPDATPVTAVAPDAASNYDGGLALTSLAVSPLALNPAFSPYIHDYYVRCAAGSNTLSLSMAASSGATVGITQPVASSGDSNVSITVTENEAIVATATSGDASEAYWIRCLPHDFPAFVTSTPGGAAPPSGGYTLVGNALHLSTESGYAIVLDANTVPVWYHATRGGAGACDVDSLAQNTISYVPYLDYTFASGNAAFEIDALDPVAVRNVTANGAPLDFHELRLLPNGDYLVFTWPIVSGVDLMGLGMFGPNEDIVDCNIQEIDPTGQTVWQWSATDHLDPVLDCTYPATVPAITTSGGVQTVVDPFHCNSIDVAPNGDLLVSARNIDSIFMVSKTTGAILWKMGGAGYTKDAAPFLQVSGDAFYRQHDARLQPDGTISIFDDQTDMPGPARAIVVSYDLTAQTASITWQFQGTETSDGVGSFRILPDGSRVVGWGLSLGSNPTFTEIDANGAVLREVTLSGDFSFRAIKVPLSALDLGQMRATAGAN